jgi:hypothetical protein
VSGNYTFDWRSEARRDGWLLEQDGRWHHADAAKSWPDTDHVYVGSHVWMETWPHAPNRAAPPAGGVAFELPDD